jgi:polyketide synthase PksJ
MPNITALLVDLRFEEKKGVWFVRSSQCVEFLSYAALYRKAQAVLGHLYRKGIGEKDEVILLTEDHPVFLAAFWACLLGKMIPVPVAVGGTDYHKQKVLKIWTALLHPALICAPEEVRRIERFARESGRPDLAIAVGDRFIDESGLEGADAVAEAQNESSASELAYLQFSSGSTGDPKGVMLTHDNLFSNTEDIIAASAITSEDTMLSWMPLTHDMGLIGVHLTGMRAKITQVLIPTALFIRHPLLWMDKVNEYKASLLYSPNFGYQYFLAAMDRRQNYGWRLQCVRIVYNGAEPIDHRICTKFLNALQPYGLSQDVMLPVYGLAEASVAVTISDPSTGMEWFSLDRNFLKPGDYFQLCTSGAAPVKLVAVGRSIRQCVIRICDDADRVLEEGRIGHIQIAGRNVTTGYYQNLTATLEICAPDGWLRTGDQGFLQNDRLVVTGRTKNIIIVRGQNYYPYDIERVVSEVKGVEEGSVVAVGYTDTDTNEECLLLFVLFKKDPSAFVHLIRPIREELVNVIGVDVQHIIPIRRIPKTTSGKVQHFRLLRQYQDGTFRDVIQQLRDLGREKTGSDPALCTLESLRRFLPAATKSLSPMDNFFAAGMDSLQLSRMLLQVQCEYEIPIQLRDIYEHPDLSSLQKIVQGKIEQAAHARVSLLPAQEFYPLSGAQQRLWVMHATAGSVTPLNIAAAYSISGQADKDHIYQACIALLHRHKSLHTIFITAEDGRPMQKQVSPGAGFFEYSDLTGDEGAIDHCSMRLRQAVNRRFDLERPPLIRFYLWKVGSGHYYFLIVVHHLIADGWGIAVLLKELGAYYGALQQTGSLPAGIGQRVPAFYEYAAGDRDQAHLAACGAYWKSRLAGAKLVQFPFLPADVTVAAYDGGYSQYKIEAATAERLHEFARVHKVSLFTILLAAFKVLLYKYSGMPDILLATMDSGRHIEHTHNLVGYLSDILCLRTVLNPENGFQQTVQQVQQTIMDAVQHAGYPFDLVIEDQKKAGLIRHEGLFNVLFVVQSFDQDWSVSSPDPSWTVERIEPEYDSTFVDLHVELIVDEKGIVVNTRYNPVIFSADQAGEINRHYEHMMKVLLESPLQPVSQFSLLSQQQQREQLERSGRGRPRTSGQDILMQLYAISARFPHHTAIVEGDNAIAYQELADRVNGMAAHLLHDDFCRPGEVIAVQLPRSIDLVVSVLAILQCRCGFLLLDMDLPAERSGYMIRDSAAALVITSQYINDLNRITGRALSPAERPADSDLGYVIYTSGSTGWPKGVIIERGSLNNYIDLFSDHFGLTFSDIVLMQSSVSFDVIVEELFPVLTRGGRIVVAGTAASDIDALCNVMHREKVTLFSTVPSVIEYLNRRRLPDSLRILISGGESFRSSQVSTMSGKLSLYNTYGPSETTVCASYFHFDGEMKNIPIGSPVDNAMLLVVDADGQPAPRGMIGELCIGGKGLARGYLNMPELTASKFVYISLTNERVYLTGDKGLLNDDGYFQYLWRKDQQVKVNGVRIELGEIEKVLESSPFIKKAVVICKPAAKGGQKMLAFYTSDQQPGPEELRRHCRKFLAHHQLPQEYVQVGSMPALPSGKIDKDALSQWIYDENVQNEDEAETPAELALASLLPALLGCRTAVMSDNFFSLGGDSIKAMQLIGEVRAKGYDLHFKDILEAYTLRSVARSMSALHDRRRKLLPAETKWVHAADRLCCHPVLTVSLGQYLDRGRLSDAVGDVIRRYACFRVRCNGSQDELFVGSQCGDEGDMLHCVYPDVRRDAKVWQVVQEEESRLRKTLNIEKGCNVRMSYIQFDDGTSALIIAVHQLVWDTSSWSALLSQLWASYRGDHSEVIDNWPVWFFDTGHFLYGLPWGPLKEAADEPTYYGHTEIKDPILIHFVDDSFAEYHVPAEDILSLAALAALRQIMGETVFFVQLWLRAGPVAGGKYMGRSTGLYPLVFQLDDQPLYRHLPDWRNAIAAGRNRPYSGGVAGPGGMPPGDGKNRLGFEYAGQLSGQETEIAEYHTDRAGMQDVAPASLRVTVWRREKALLATVTYDRNLFNEQEIMMWDKAFTDALYQLYEHFSQVREVVLLPSDFDTVQLDQSDLSALFS